MLVKTGDLETGSPLLRAGLDDITDPNSGLWYLTGLTEMAEALVQAGRIRRRASNGSISDEAREDAVLTANSAAASYQQAIADRSTAQFNLERTILRAPVNGFITNLTLEVGQYASVGTKIMALIDSDSYRVTAYFE